MRSPRALKIAFFCLLLAIGVANAGQLALEPSNSNTAKEASAAAQTWVNALLKKDFETLISVSFSDYQSGMRRDLSDNQSRLFKALYIAKKSPYRKLEHVHDIGIVVLAHKELTSLGSGTTACFFNRLKPPKAWPTDSVLLPNIEKRNDVYCIFLVRSDGGWQVSTDFVER